MILSLSPAGEKKEPMPDRETTPGQSEKDCPFFLSPRQRQVLALAARGLTSREIALQLTIEPGTVGNHLSRAREALGAQNTTHAVVIALVRGLIEFEGCPDWRGARGGCF
jgi:DNA-binding NarL/FixJ family response regulator